MIQMNEAAPIAHHRGMPAMSAVKAHEDLAGEFLGEDTTAAVQIPRPNRCTRATTVSAETAPVLTARARNARCSVGL